MYTFQNLKVGGGVLNLWLSNTGSVAYLKASIQWPSSLLLADWFFFIVQRWMDWMVFAHLGMNKNCRLAMIECIMALP
jgi:hypothetical protein